MLKVYSPSKRIKQETASRSAYHPREPIWELLQGLLTIQENTVGRYLRPIYRSREHSRKLLESLLVSVRLLVSVCVCGLETSQPAAPLWMTQQMLGSAELSTTSGEYVWLFSNTANHPREHSRKLRAGLLVSVR